MSGIPPSHARLEVVEKRIRDPSSELNVDSLLVGLIIFVISHLNNGLFFNVVVNASMNLLKFTQNTKMVHVYCK